MFAKHSRYAKLPELVTTDATGRAVATKGLRLLPETRGDFQHTVQENDRLDQLAYHYYKQPQRWWRICDANPDVLSPQVLLGQTALVTQRIPLLIDADQPAWAALLAGVQSLLGVVDAQLRETFELVVEAQLVDDTLFEIYREVQQAVLVVTYLTSLTTIQALVAAISAAGFVAGTPQTVTPIGKRITIPPDSLK